jgi:hypothetical protein
MKRVLSAVLFCTLLAVSAAAAQTTTSVKFKSANPYGTFTGFGVYVGPYQLQFNPSPFSALPGAPIVDAFCVDFGHHISASTWQARIVGMNNLSGIHQYTRQGVLIPANVAMAQRNYLAAAWLATQMMAVPPSQRASGASAWKWYHGAIWHIMGRGANDVLNSGEPFYAQYNPLSSAEKSQIQTKFQAALNTGVGQMAGHEDEWVVVSPTNLSSATSSQEFITRNVVPEPATLILLASGLLALGLVAYFRSGLA